MAGGGGEYVIACAHACVRACVGASVCVRKRERRERERKRERRERGRKREKGRGGREREKGRERERVMIIMILYYPKNMI